MSSILVLGMDQPLPPHGGTRLRLLHLARQAARRHEVSMFAMGEPDPGAAAEPFAVEGAPWGHGRVAALARSVNRPYLYRRLHSPALARRVAAHPADLVQVSSIYFRDAAPGRGRPVVLDAHNVEEEIVRSQAESDTSALQRLRWRWETATTRRFEQRAVAGFDAVLACSDLDAAHFERFSDRVVVVPNGVDVAATPFRPPPARPQLAYLGMYSYRPNEVAALTLADEVFPRVRAEIPDASLRLIGADPTPDLLARAGPGIEVTGRVDDAVHELQQARALVIALKAGSGTRLKAIEAMAAGVVVVSTSTGLAGIGAVDGEHVLVADTVDDLAAATRRVLTDDDLAGHLATSARAMVAERFDWARCAEPMHAVHDDLLGRAVRD